MTIMLARGAGNPDRVEHAVRILRPSPLSEVAEAVAAFADARPDAVYVERLEEDLYRWSPATRGGPYPLVRILAAFLECSHNDMTVGYITLDGWCIARSPEDPVPDARIVLESPPRDRSQVARQIVEELG